MNNTPSATVPQLLGEYERSIEYTNTLWADLTPEEVNWRPHENFIASVGTSAIKLRSRTSWSETSPLPSRAQTQTQTQTQNLTASWTAPHPSHSAAAYRGWTACAAIATERQIVFDFASEI
jgi:hypothetical protein